MNIQKDNNNLLTIFNENIPQTKEYTYQVSGYTFSDFDKWIVVLHKKEWKIISLKNLGDNMSVVYIKKTINNTFKFNEDMFATALTIFHGFNETTGEIYAFMPNISEKEAQEKNELFKKLKTEYNIKKTEKWMIMNKYLEEEKRKIPSGDINSYLNYLFGLFIMYGKFEAKKGELAGIKIQIQLFWWYMELQIDRDDLIKTLQQEWIFLKADKLPNKNGIVYQISCNDYELLEIFAQWYEAVEKFEKITKREFTQEMKTKLIEFIETNVEIPQDGKVEVIKQLKEWTIKLLTK